MLRYVVAGFCSVLLLTLLASIFSSIYSELASSAFLNWFAFVLLVIVATIAVCYVTLFSEACSEFFSDHGKLWVCSLVVLGAVLLFSMGLLPLLAGVLATVDAATTPVHQYQGQQVQHGFVDGTLSTLDIVGTAASFAHI